jgi:hypothetical protein
MADFDLVPAPRRTPAGIDPALGCWRRIGLPVMPHPRERGAGGGRQDQPTHAVAMVLFIVALLDRSTG